MMKKWTILYASLFALYGFVGYFSFGYDDEFFNIFEIERLGFKVAHLVQTSDVHPPGSYILDWALFSVFQQWELVRLFISLASALSIVFAIHTIRKRSGDFAGLVAFLLLGLNPSLLLWCTSLRWYAFFVPVLIFLSFPSRRVGWRYWIKCFGGLLILGYLGYAMFIVAIPLILLYWHENKERLKEKIIGAAFPIVLFVTLYSYQMYVFLTIHAANGSAQRSSIFKSIAGVYISQLSNQGVFPLSIFGILSSIGVVAIVAISTIDNPKINIRNSYLISYVLSLLFCIASGIAGKFRNLVAITPWFCLYVATAVISKQRRALFSLSLLFIVVGNIGGIYNVASHSNTIKNKWNLPINEIISYSKEQRERHRDVVIICHDFAISWALEKAGFKVLGPYTSVLLNQKTIESDHICVVLLKTYLGEEMIQNRYPQMLSELQQIKCDSFSNFKLKRDAFFKYKKVFEPHYQEYLVYGCTYINVRNLKCLKSWQPDHYFKVEKP